MKNCGFQIPRGNTSRYVYIFINKGSYYKVTLKVLYGSSPYRTLSTVKVPTSYLGTYINTVVANTY